MIIKENLKITGEVVFTLYDTKTGKQKIYKYKNLFTLAGKIAIARRLAGVALYANEGQATYAATGTGSTSAPALGDIKLNTELYRNTVSSGSYSANISVIRGFYNTTESNGTLTEFGLFGEAATGAADSGTLFNRVVIAITKTNTQTLTFEARITIS